MLKNYLLTTFRSFRKNTSYLIINAFGLGIALACCLTAYILLAYNIEFDQAVEDEEVTNIFRVHSLYTQPDGSEGQNAIAPVNLGPAIAAEISGVERFTRYNSAGGFVRFGDKSFSEGVRFADSTFFDLFTYELIKGSFESFKDLNTVMISQFTADRFFDKENPIGQVLTFNFANQTQINAVVGAVYKNAPANSSLTFDIMMRHEHFMDIYNITSSDWGDWRDPALLVELTDPERAKVLPSLLQDYITLRNEMKPDAKLTRFEFQHFKKSLGEDDVSWAMINTRISIIPLVVFSTMAILILLIACFNLTNISFAMTARRLKEVGVRKVIGASRTQIIVQFLTEMFVTIILSLAVGLVMAKFIAAEFTDMWNLPYGIRDLSGLNLVITLLILVFVASLLAGLYPALSNSKFLPVQLLKSSVKLKGANLVTKTLVTIQFAISVFVLVNGIVFIQNTKFQESIDYGYDMENVLVLSIQGKSDYDLLKSRVEANPKVTNYAITHHQMGWSSYPFPVIIDTSEYQVQHIEVGENFFETMGLTLIEGRFLNMKNATDQTDAMVVNQAFVKATKLTDPLGRYVTVRGEKKRVVGVVENHVDNLFRSSEPEPFAYYGSKPHEYQLMLVKGNIADMSEINTYLEEVWDEEIPNRPYQANYQSENVLGNFRQTNANLKKIFLFLTVLGGLLSVSGIFALASLNVEKRTKEIGIRKVLGGSVIYLVKLLSKEFAIILGIACLVGSVGGFFLSTALLGQIYAYHITVGAMPLILSSLIIFSMGILTTSWIVTRAAAANPIFSLRDE